MVSTEHYSNHYTDTEESFYSKLLALVFIRMLVHIYDEKFYVILGKSTYA